METLETSEAKLYKALDNMEAVIQHNESDISTWLPLEYELQLTHGEKACLLYTSNRLPEEYEGPEEAAAELEKYFGEIDGLLKERLREVKERAEAIYREYVKEEISKLKAKKTVMEAGG